MGVLGASPPPPSLRAGVSTGGRFRADRTAGLATAVGSGHVSGASSAGISPGPAGAPPPPLLPPPLPSLLLLVVVLLLLLLLLVVVVVVLLLLVVVLLLLVMLLRLPVVRCSTLPGPRRE